MQRIFSVEDRVYMAYRGRMSGRHVEWYAVLTWVQMDSTETCECRPVLGGPTNGGVPGMPNPYEGVHTALERYVGPKMRVGVQISVIAAAILICCVPGYGMLHAVIPVPLLWALTVVGALMLVCGVMAVFVLPRYYRRVSRLIGDENPVQMRVTLRFETGPEGNVKVFADLRPRDSIGDEPPSIVVPVLNKLDMPPNFPAEVYGTKGGGPVTVQTAHGILWPAPDESQQRLEETLKAEI